MSGPTDAPDPDEIDHLTEVRKLVVQYALLLTRLASKSSGGDNVGWDLLLTRDRLADAVAKAGSIPQAVAENISNLDDKLRKYSSRIMLSNGATIKDLRDILQPPDRNWWWYQEDLSSSWWTISSLIFLTLSVTMIADFTRRMFLSDSNELGLFAVAAQAILAAGATSTFTEGGRQWLEAILSRIGVRKQFQLQWKFGATLALLSIVTCAWERGPSKLAVRDNDNAFYAFHGTPMDSANAVRLYQRAITLDPTLYQAHFNLGFLYERNYQYDKAASEYREAIIGESSFVPAYSSLSHVLLLGNQPLTALRVSDEATKLLADDSEKNQFGDYRILLSTNRAWAEYLLGLDSDAEIDVEAARCFYDMEPASIPCKGQVPLDQENRCFSKVAALTSAYCIMGKIYDKEGKKLDAQQAWANFRRFYPESGEDEVARIEPDCKRLSEEAAFHETK